MSEEITREEFDEYAEMAIRRVLEELPEHVATFSTDLFLLVLVRPDLPGRLQVFPMTREEGLRKTRANVAKAGDDAMAAKYESALRGKTWPEIPVLIWAFPWVQTASVGYVPGGTSTATRDALN